VKIVLTSAGNNSIINSGGEKTMNVKKTNEENMLKLPDGDIIHFEVVESDKKDNLAKTARKVRTANPQGDFTNIAVAGK